MRDALEKRGADVGRCATLVQRLLSATSHLHVVVTTRERLGIEGEHIFPVRVLASPNESITSRSNALVQFEAVRLFVDRARQVAPDFKLGADNAAAVGAICRRLDGIPLALELAAARVQLLSPQQIHAMLDDRFRLLAADSHSTSRHQTLLASLESSHEQLLPDDRDCLRRLSIFVGGWTLEAATAVCEQPDDIGAVRRLCRLVDKSLIVVDRQARDGPRYRMLETVREYVARKLRDSDERNIVSDRHLRYFLAFAKRAQANLFGADMKSWLDKLDDELPNLLAAHAWCDDAREGPTQGLELAANLRTYWLGRGLFELGQRVYDEALRRPGIDAGSMLFGKTLYALGQHQYVRGRLAAVLEPTRRALAIARFHGDDEWTVYCLDRISLAHLWLGDVASARECADEEMTVAQKTGNRRLMGFAFTARGAVCRATGDLAGSADAYEHALRLFDGEQDLNNRHNALIDIARVSVSSGAIHRAREALVAAIQLVSSTGTMYRGHFALEAASLLAAAGEEWRRAASFQGAADAAVDKVGGLRTWFDDPVLSMLRERPQSMLGSRDYDAAYKAGRELALDAALINAAAWIADAQHPGDVRDAAARKIDAGTRKNRRRTPSEASVRRRRTAADRRR